MAKVSPDCGRSLPATLEFFYAKGDRLYSYCKECNSRQCKTRYEKNPEKYAAHNLAYRTENPEKIAEINRAYYLANREELLAKTTEYQKAHPDQRRETSSRYAGSHKEQCSERQRRWRENNPEKNATKERNRRARKKAVGGQHTLGDVAAQCNRQKGKCYWCKGKLDKYHVDHVTPLALGGSNGPENIVIACPTCNLTKHAKHPMDFAGILL